MKVPEAQALPHSWSKDALLAKAQQYSELMHAFPDDDWRYGFWSTLSLELLARAALAHISPVLLADSRNDWNHTYFALGLSPKVNKFVPKSIATGDVLKRLKDVQAEFRSELMGFAIGHIARRNEELHSGSRPFVGISAYSWLPAYYETCDVLLQSIGSSLEVFLGKGRAKIASTMIAASLDKAAKVILKLVSAHRKQWKSKSKEDQKRLSLQASTWAARNEGHRVKCPACASHALVMGQPIAAPIKSIDGDEITETQQFLPAKFECVACALKVSGYSQLNACGLGATYKATHVYDAAEYYGSEDQFPEYEPDYND